MSYWKCKNCGEDCCVREEITRLREERDAYREALESIRDGKDKCHGMIIADMGFKHFAQHTAKLALDEYKPERTLFKE
jgi:uncharacterized protein (DUF849 family)